MLLLVAVNALYAQIPPPNNGKYPTYLDTVFYDKYAQSVVQNAPVIVKGQIVGGGLHKIKREAWVSFLVEVTQGIRGGFAPKDTIEVLYANGCYYETEADSIERCPMHRSTPSPIMANHPKVDEYFFLKPTNLPKHYKHTKQAFVFHDELVLHTGHRDYFTDAKDEDKLGFVFYRGYKDEAAFLEKTGLKKLIDQNQKPTPPQSKTTKKRQPIYNKKGKRIGRHLLPTTTVYLSTANEQTTTSNGKRYLEFDILARANTNINIGYIKINMKFDPNLFSTSANDIFLSLGGGISSSTYVRSLSIGVAGTDTLGLAIGNLNTNNLTQLTTTDRVILHHKIAIVGCATTSSYKFRASTNGQYILTVGPPTSIFHFKKTTI
ncbi:MAG: hypothetical protein RI894_775 [Bacteroidota bacterium]